MDDILIFCQYSYGLRLVGTSSGKLIGFVFSSFLYDDYL